MEEEDILQGIQRYLICMEFEGKCRFNGCVHVNEPGCAVKMAVDEGILSKDRYQSYVTLYEELKNKKKY